MASVFRPRNLPRSVESELKYGKRPMHEYLKINASRLPDKVAINYYGTEITYRELDYYVDCFATLLTRIGVKKGDTVALYMQNSPQLIISYYGTQRIGAVVGACSPMLKEWELEHELNELQSKVIVANDYLYPIISNVKNKCGLEQIILSSFQDFLPEMPTIPLGSDMDKPKVKYPDTLDLMEELKGIEPNVPAVEIDMDNDIALIVFTSGSTGLPKGAMLTYYSELFKTYTTGTAYYSTEYDTFLCTMPVFHIAGNVFMHIQFYNGATMVLLTRYTPEAVMTAIDRYKCNKWYGTAIMNNDILNHPDLKKYNLCSMRINPCTSFGIQLSEELAKKWYEVTKGGIVLEAAYGLSESHTMDTVMPIEKIKYGSTGIPMFEGMEIRIVDFETGKECNVGEMGEITVKNPAVFKGYLNNPEATANALKDGWLYTGDIGKVDEEGYLYFMGRKKEMIKSSGYSVFPEEVELYLLKHDAVAQAAVIGKPHGRKGELVKAFIVLNEAYKGKVSEQELLDWAKDKMAAYKAPREIEFRDSLPMSGTGKLLRRVLLEEEKSKLEVAASD